jgi:CTP synthase (UTP-ammonia lyase)
MTRIALIGDFDESITAHRATPPALAAVAKKSGIDVQSEWIHTSRLGPDVRGRLADFDGVWVVPGSPYADTAAVLTAIELARTSRRPFLGTCGGFQHAMLEFARGVWDIHAPAHAETEPDAGDPVISLLECSLVEARESIHFVAGTELRRIYGADSTQEEYRCRYGLSPRYAERLSSGALRASARDERGGIVGVELNGHPFFIAVLFQPERAGLRGESPPLVEAFVKAANRTRIPSTS